MKKSLKRREFIGRTALVTLSAATLGACTAKENSPAATPEAPSSDENTFKDELAKNRQMPRDLVMQMLDQKVEHYMQLTHHCAQSSFMVLNDQFGLGGTEIFKALTPMPGIAERGETCGAVTGPLMAMGLIYGRDLHHMDDWDAYQRSLIPTRQFCDQFEKEFGTTLCSKVQEGKFGRCYRLSDPAQLQEFQNAGATEKCSEVVQSAVHMAAIVILDDTTLS
jgi:C_GCAxxG_C_C family probable redox protein